jgi:predicted nuclease with RNAse H fold
MFFWSKPPYRIGALLEVVDLVSEKDFIACAIDAPLTFIPQSKKWRLSDIELRCLLDKDFKNWVQSPNSMQAVPLRAQQLTSLILPYVSTIIETHPRSSLAFILNKKNEALKRYKTSLKHLNKLKELIFNRLSSLLNTSFTMSAKEIETDGALDAFICALISFIYIKDYKRLYKLPLGAGARGFAPFYVFKPSHYKKKQKIRYTAGNLGDILKHSWLLAIAEWLLRETSKFSYVDTFCGFPIYPTQAKVILYFEERLKNLDLYKFQKPYLLNGQYAGSAHLVKLLCTKKKKPYIIDIYDKEPEPPRLMRPFFKSHLCL